MIQSPQKIQTLYFLFFKEKEFFYNNIPIIHMNEGNFEKYFIPKRKKIFKPPTIINNKKIFFKDKKIKLF